MTEKTIVELKKEDRQLLKSVIDILKKPEPTIDPVEKQTPKEITKANVDHVMDCPNCYPLVKQRVIEREFKDADHECEECGLPAKGEESGKEDWKCPSCGHKYAKPKD